MLYTDDKYVKNTIFKRSADTHKGDFGRVLVFAGSPGMAGAAVLAGRGALKSGAGLVSFLLPDMSDPVYPILQTSVPEATCVEYSENINFSDYDVIAAGPGLGESDDRLFILSMIIENYAGILVLDADALNAVSRYPELADTLADSEARVIITPHPGEACRLMRLDPSLNDIRLSGDRRLTVTALAKMFGCIAILKGSATLVCANTAARENYDDIYDVFENITGNPGMATGGSGDVLTGIIAGLAAQGYSPLDASRLGVFIHGKAGDIAAGKLSEMGMTASDIANCVPYALKIYSSKEDFV